MGSKVDELDVASDSEVGNLSSFVGTRVNLALTDKFLSLFIKVLPVGESGDVGNAAAAGSCTEDSLRTGE